MVTGAFSVGKLFVPNETGLDTKVVAEGKTNRNTTYAFEWNRTMIFIGDNIYIFIYLIYYVTIDWMGVYFGISFL